MPSQLFAAAQRVKCSNAMPLSPCNTRDSRSSLKTLSHNHGSFCSRPPVLLAPHQSNSVIKHQKPP